MPTLPAMSAELFKKYDFQTFHYAEYPHKSFWTDRPNPRGFRKAMTTMFARAADVPLLLYIHIPFCEKQCLFCSCRTVITRDYAQTTNYIRTLCAEIALYRDFLSAHGVRPNIAEIHIGGGTPSAVREAEFDQLIDALGSLVDLTAVREFAIEIDPRNFAPDKLAYYLGKGVNRISFGVQEFDPDIQRTVNRVQPVELLETLLERPERRRFHSTSFDLLMGLPRQTPEAFRHTMAETIRLAPDRIVLIYFMFAPAYSPHMNVFDPAEIPDMRGRAECYFIAREMLSNGGYARIGADTYARPSDSLVDAARARTLEWNCLGYSPGRYQNILGLGVSSSMRVAGTSYFQNAHSLAEWAGAIENGQFPVARSYLMNDDDVIRRDVIHSLRNYLSVDTTAISARHRIRFDDYFGPERRPLEDLAADGLVELSGSSIRITELGACLTDTVCRVFDNCHTEKRHFALAPTQ